MLRPGFLNQKPARERDLTYCMRQIKAHLKSEIKSIPSAHPPPQKTQNKNNKKWQWQLYKE